jgi:arylsulfatase A-like enzyme
VNFPRRFAPAALLAILAAVAIACAGKRQEPPLPLPRATRGYVLISIDTLRADHLGCYGYARPTSPFLDSLARRGTLFEEAYSQFPSTLVSHMSMLTGLYPREHAVLATDAVLAPEVETVAEVFQRDGFHTGAFTEGGYVSGRYGFRRGFDQFESHDRNRHRQVALTFRRGVEFLEELKPGERFFLFLHTYAVHTPYDAPEEYVKPFWPGGPPAGAVNPSGAGLTRVNAMGEPLPAPVVDWLRALYDGGIRQTDDEVGKFFADLERLGLSRDVTVIVTADHGEEFLEHGLFNHTQLYRETLHVPLLVIHPDQHAPVRHGGVAQLVDVAPTLYELARVHPKGHPSGISRARQVGRPAPAQAGTAWSEAFDGQRALYRGEAKKLASLLVFDPPAETWFSRRLTFDTSGGLLAFEARSYEKTRHLVVRQGNAVLTRATLVPDWASVQVATAGPGRLTLEDDGCEFPDSDAPGQELACYGFQARGLRPARIELYDVAKDPAQRQDVSRQQGRTLRDLLRDLVAFQPRPVAAAGKAALDPELEKSLRALGYLN